MTTTFRKTEKFLEWSKENIQTHANLIKNCSEIQNIQVDRNCVQNLYIYWVKGKCGSRETVYYNPVLCDFKNNYEYYALKNSDINKVIAVDRTPSSYYNELISYIKYHSDIKALEISTVHVDLKRGTEEQRKEPRDVEFRERFFIFKTSPFVYNKNGEVTLVNKTDIKNDKRQLVSYNNDFKRKITSWLGTMSATRGYFTDNQVDQIKLYTNGVTSIDNDKHYNERYKKFYHSYSFGEWYQKYNFDTTLLPSYGKPQTKTKIDEQTNKEDVLNHLNETLDKDLAFCTNNEKFWNHIRKQCDTKSYRTPRAVFCENYNGNGIFTVYTFKTEYHYNRISGESRITTEEIFLSNKVVIFKNGKAAFYRLANDHNWHELSKTLDHSFLKERGQLFEFYNNKTIESLDVIKYILPKTIAYKNWFLENKSALCSSRDSNAAYHHEKLLYNMVLVLRNPLAEKLLSSKLFSLYYEFSNRSFNAECIEIFRGLTGEKYNIYRKSIDDYAYYRLGDSDLTKINIKKKNFKLTDFGLTMKQIQYINDETLKDYIDTADTQSYWRESRIYQACTSHEFDKLKGLLFPGTKTSDIDMETFKKMMEFCSFSDKYSYRNSCNILLESLYKFNEDGQIIRYGSYDNWRKRFNKHQECTTEELKQLPEKARKAFNKIYKLMQENNSENIDIISLLGDTLQLYFRLRFTRPGNMDVLDEIDSVQRLQNMHDIFIELSAQEQDKEDEFLTEEYEKLFEKKSKKFGFENDEYIIVPPKAPSELVKEGTNLHHCVGGYVNKAVNDTNILFLRKKEEEQKSFFTIEVNTYNQLVQIHGFGNKWLGSCEDGVKAIPFVKKWLDDKEIQYDKNILLCTSQSYGRTGDYLPESYLYG